MMTDYQDVDPAYKTLLRLIILMDSALLLVFCALLTGLLSVVPLWAGTLIAGLTILLAGVYATFWVNRRYRLTGYLVQPQAVYFRTGALWRTQTVVTLNRIQHVEITQGPLERLLKLARLVIYTAGGRGSDLTIPGLPVASAESIRDGLLQRIDEQPRFDDQGQAEAVSDEHL
jgi:uncharacterized protein